MKKLEKPVQRRYVYKETANEIIEWAREMKEKGMLDPSPNNYKPNFPFSLEQYLKHLKFKIKQLEKKVKN